MNNHKILITGGYQPDYNRTNIILAGLEEIGVEVVQFPFLRKNASVKKQLSELQKDVNFIFLPSFTHADVSFVKRNTCKPVIFDPLISKYLAKVFDYKQVGKYSIRALKNYLKDKIPMSKADIVIADTQANKRYYVNTFNINPDKIAVIPIGVNVHDFYPAPPVSPQMGGRVFRVGFYGGFIPLHGVKKIIDAARILKGEEDIVFELAGNGYEYEKIRKDIANNPVNNIELPGWIEYAGLNRKINEFDLCLGIFGDTPKADMVIPNKVFHYMACRKCTITKETPAIKEIFKNEENIFLVNADPEAIAEKIVFLKKNRDKMNEAGERGYQLISNGFNQKMIAEMLVNVFDKIIL